MNTPLVDIRGLAIDYPGRRPSLWRTRERVRAVHGVDLQIDAGQTLGLVGESGSGKSSIGQVVLGTLAPAAGAVRVGDWDLAALRGQPPAAYRNVVQMVWQNPYASLTPTLAIGEQIAEPLRRQGGIDAAARQRRVARLLEQVGLQAADAAKLPHQFSGGQRQRIAIARALAPSPTLIVLDEPVSALDVITQAQVLRLLEDVQRDTGVAYLLISHDIGVVRHLASRMAVLRRGELVETGDTDRVCDHPQHAYTQSLIEAVLEPRPHSGASSSPRPHSGASLSPRPHSGSPASSS